MSEDFKNCNICENKGLCVGWKTASVRLRDENERTEPVNLVALAAKKMVAGKNMAGRCSKYYRSYSRSSK
jgi:hypothetical protein